MHLFSDSILVQKVLPRMSLHDNLIVWDIKSTVIFRLCLTENHKTGKYFTGNEKPPIK